MAGDDEIASLNASRGYCKGTVTRLQNAVSNLSDVKSESYQALLTKRDRLVTVFREYEQINMRILCLDVDDKEDIGEVEYSFTARAYQLERDITSEPTVKQFLEFLERRALALENVEPSTSKVTKVVVNVAAVPESKSTCQYCPFASAAAA